MGAIAVTEEVKHCGEIELALMTVPTCSQVVPDGVLT
jgi:hypothetical protein